MISLSSLPLSRIPARLLFDCLPKRSLRFSFQYLSRILILLLFEHFPMVRIPSPFFQLRLPGIRELRSCFPINCPCRFQPEEPVTCPLPSLRLHRTQCNGKCPPAHSRRCAESSPPPEPPGPRGYPQPGAHREWSDKAASVR